MSETNTNQSDEVLEEETSDSLSFHHRSSRVILFSSLSAGLEIGFSLVALVAIYTTLSSTELSQEMLYFLVGFGYPIGFILVVIGNSDLFTEHTTRATYPVLTGEIGVLRLLKTWGLILTGNLIGGYIFAFLLTTLAGHIAAIQPESIVAIAHHELETQGWPMFLSALLAGWLMGLVSWLVASSCETISQIVVTFLITLLIGIAGLHHSIVGSIEIFSGLLLSDNIGIMDYLKFEVVAILGNVVGGVVFVALIKFAQKSEQYPA